MADQPWRPVHGMFCVGGPVEGCTFALAGCSFGAPGLVLVGLGEPSPARCTSLLNRAGFVSLSLPLDAANDRGE